MQLSTTAPPVVARPPGLLSPGLLSPGVLAIVAAVSAATVLYWLCDLYPARLPDWAPWEFSWTQFLAAVLSLWWYAHGVALTEPAERPGVWRQGAFGLGVLLIYAVLLTHFEYMAQHMFFLNRLQHMVMHHLGPFLIALAWPADSLLRGMPEPVRRLVQCRPLCRLMWLLQQPVLAGGMFVGLIYLWLIPAVHFRAMIDPNLYTVMNWSMVIDGLMFWSLVLDPRPEGEARTSCGGRLLITILVMFPQIALGSAITFSTTSLYPYYDLCGRLFPTVGAILDQHIGGVILWIPSSMMSSLCFLLILNNLRRLEDRMAPVEYDDDDGDHIQVFSASWTGRPVGGRRVADAGAGQSRAGG